MLHLPACRGNCAETKCNKKMWHAKARLKTEIKWPQEYLTVNGNYIQGNLSQSREMMLVAGGL